MTRAFSPEPLDPRIVDDLLDLATRAPSAGKAQGWHFVVLDGERTRRFWDATLSADKRTNFAWPQLLDAPVIILPFADPGQYLERYSQTDKAATGLGEHYLGRLSGVVDAVNRHRIARPTGRR